MRSLKAIGGERSHIVLDALVKRVERNSGTVAERISVDYCLEPNDDEAAGAATSTEHFTDST